MRVPPRLFPQTLTTERCIEKDAFGMCIEFRGNLDIPARFDNERKLIRSASGAEVVSGTTIYLPASADILLDDIIVSPAEIANHSIIELIDHPDRHGGISYRQAEVT